MLTSIILVFLKDYYAIQLQLMILLSLLAQLALGFGKPNEFKSDNMIAFLIEISTSIYLYVLLLLTDFFGPNPFREIQGTALVIIVIIVVSVNLLILLSKLLF